MVRVKDSLPASNRVFEAHSSPENLVIVGRFQRGLCPPKAEAASSNLAGCATLSADFDTAPFALPTAQRDNNAAILRELARAKCEFQLRAIVAAMGVGL